MPTGLLDFTIKIQDAGLHTRIAKAGPTAHLALKTAINAWAQLILRDAKKNLVPGHGRRTGALANSLHALPQGDGMIVGPSVDYGAYVEFGTGMRGLDSVQPEALRAFGMDQGVFDHGWAGMDAQHYLWKAYKSSLPEAKRLLAAAGKKIVTAIAK